MTERSTTRIIHTPCSLAIHRLSSLNTEVEAWEAAQSVVNQIEQATPDLQHIGLILDLRGYQMTSLRAHGIWSKAIKQHPCIAQRVTKAAIVANDSATFRTERALLQTATLCFFTDFHAAIAWHCSLLSKAQIEHLMQMELLS